MAPESFGRAVGNSLVNGAADGGPPPSTLAAQLVENISASTRSSRPDETRELKKLFAIIEEVKNQPDLLKTPEEQVEHNHKLIYVYAQVVLDALKWDDLFANREALRTEALNAIQFLRITIKETPSVLAYRADEGTFIFRGQEPLWLWVLPKVLAMLGHHHCIPIAPTIEELCRFIIFSSARTPVLAAVAGDLVRYFQGNVQGV